MLRTKPAKCVRLLLALVLLEESLAGSPALLAQPLLAHEDEKDEQVQGVAQDDCCQQVLDKESRGKQRVALDFSGVNICSPLSRACFAFGTSSKVRIPD
jgi:hypothetical protein